MLMYKQNKWIVDVGVGVYVDVGVVVDVDVLVICCLFAGCDCAYASKFHIATEKSKLF